MIEKTQLRDGGVLLFDACFLAVDEADALLANMLDGIPWKQEGGKGSRVPRLTARYADAGLLYRYSGSTHKPRPWRPT